MGVVSSSPNVTSGDAVHKVSLKRESSQENSYVFCKALYNSLV